MMNENDFSGRYAIGKVRQIAEELSCDGAEIRQLIDWLQHSSDKRVRMNAAWVLNNIDRNTRTRLLLPYRDELTDLAMCDLPFRRQMILSLLLDFPVDNNPRIDLLDYCLEHLCDEKESPSSRAFMIYLAAKMCKPYPELYAELLNMLDMLPAVLPPSIACAKRKVKGNMPCNNML
ncbi:hypothetical protein HPS57_00190 [Prevotella sp. PINT]|jgi:hypothetical protein|uniref:hypothetical protein n=1 Tax=Palleniella intestinalis TaxID=2736291 RepID=UPI0015580F56|nr:hypothetical protein [Palleniella intestinalis]NPD80401.1 hypothetical protein [Palleniella intestinalis]